MRRVGLAAAYTREGRLSFKSASIHVFASSREHRHGARMTLACSIHHGRPAPVRSRFNQKPHHPHSSQQGMRWEVGEADLASDTYCLIPGTSCCACTVSAWPVKAAYISAVNPVPVESLMLQQVEQGSIACIVRPRWAAR